jgi:hypothetical protein
MLAVLQEQLPLLKPLLQQVQPALQYLSQRVWCKYAAAAVAC